MKNILYAITLLAAILLSGCSSGGGSPQDQLAEIDRLMSKKISMTSEQAEAVRTSLEKGKQLLSSGNQKEASEAFSETLAILQRAMDADLLNKSD